MSNTLATVTESVGNSLSASDREIVQSILYSHNHSSSALQLKSLLGLKSIVQANAAIGRLGKKIYHLLGTHPDGLSPGGFQWWTVAATGHKDNVLGFVWSLREDVVSGLIAAGYSNSGVLLPEEVAPAIREGALKRITVNSYERNPVARARCIAAHGTNCAVCGFNFGATYGAEAEGYIHVHHLVQLSDIGEDYEVDPVRDLRPVCPNCHAVIHMKNPPNTIEQARSLLAPNNSFKPTPLRGAA